MSLLFLDALDQQAAGGTPLAITVAAAESRTAAIALATDTPWLPLRRDLALEADTVAALAASFLEDGTPTSPDQVTCTLRRPDGTSIDLPVQAQDDPAGVYTAQTLIDAPGRWAYRFQAVGLDSTGSTSGTIWADPPTTG